MEKTWILVANASRAVLYAYTHAKGKPALAVIEEFEHPASRQKDVELVSDREGQYRGGEGGHGNFIEETDPHKYQAVLFARELFHKLEKEHAGNKYQELILVAGPHFLGLLRQCINDRPLADIVVREIPKDYSQETTQELITLLNL